MQTAQGLAFVNGTRLYYEIGGSGSPLVLIHGNTLDSRMWDDQFEAFGRQYQVIRYDMRGYGQSDLPTAAHYSPAGDLKNLLHYLGLDHAHILGSSRGGAVALDFALTYPEITDSLVLADAGLREFQWQTFGKFSSQVRAVAAAAGIGEARRLWLEGALFAPARERPAVAARLRQMVAEYSGWHWLNEEALELLEPPPTQQLHTINKATLVAVGARDLPDFHQIADLVHQRIPGSCKMVLAGVGHLANMEDPVRFNKTVLDFLAATGDSSRAH